MSSLLRSLVLLLFASQVVRADLRPGSLFEADLVRRRSPTRHRRDQASPIPSRPKNARSQDAVPDSNYYVCPQTIPNQFEYPGGVSTFTQLELELGLKGSSNDLVCRYVDTLGSQSECHYNPDDGMFSNNSPPGQDGVCDGQLDKQQPYSTNCFTGCANGGADSSPFVAGNYYLMKDPTYPLSIICFKAGSSCSCEFNVADGSPANRNEDSYPACCLEKGAPKVYQSNCVGDFGNGL